MSERIANRGSFASEDEALDAVVARLVETLDPVAIWLFGSRARGTHAPNSDFDLFVVTKDGDGEAGDDDLRVARPLYGLGVGCDVVPSQESDFEALKDDWTSFCWHVLTTGRCLYRRDVILQPSVSLVVVG